VSEKRVVMRAAGLQHAYGGCVVLRGIDLALEPRQVTGIVGDNGSSKSTLLKVFYRA
jgi:ABC-type sugar transport system ATPase subunit